jgi:hypothetical protein
VVGQSASMNANMRTCFCGGPFTFSAGCALLDKPEILGFLFENCCKTTKLSSGIIPRYKKTKFQGL